LMNTPNKLESKKRKTQMKRLEILWKIKLGMLYAVNILSWCNEMVLLRSYL
jgi:hypothetical protein